MSCINQPSYSSIGSSDAQLEGMSCFHRRPTFSFKVLNKFPENRWRKDCGTDSNIPYISNSYRLRFPKNETSSRGSRSIRSMEERDDRSPVSEIGMERIKEFNHEPVFSLFSESSADDIMHMPYDDDTEQIIT
eukprot:UN33053